ncbi:MAG: hypothetical protein FWD91_03320 [Treponema sp.]|nr:hypothetical protein [Treponema sp.]
MPPSDVKKNSMKLAHVIEERRDERLPLVPLPSEKDLLRRKILVCYGREMRNRKRPLNTLRVLFVHHGHTTIVKKDLATTERRQEAVKVLSGIEME